MKVLLIEPPFTRLYKSSYALCRYPLSLGYLAGAIQKGTRWEVMTYNADFQPDPEPSNVTYLVGAGFQSYLGNLRTLSAPLWDEVRATVADFRPDVVGISAKSQNFASARLVARLAKECDPAVTVVLGGPHVSMVGSQVFRCPDIDIAVKGEGEETIVEVLNTIAGGGTLEGVRGTLFRQGTSVIENPPRDLLEDLDSLPFPHESAASTLKDYHLYPPSAFRFIFASRGCPFNCVFCGSRYLWTRRVRRRSVANVIREIQGLQKLGVPSVHFDDDTIGAGKGHLAELCEGLAAGCPGLKWSCELHVNLVEDSTLALMKKAGCTLIQVGIESGNNRILKEIRKGFTIDKAISKSRLIRKHGITLATFFMAGFATETEASMQDTARAMRACKPDEVGYSIFTPYPGTEAFEQCRQMGIVDDSFDVSLYNHQSPANHFCPNIPLARFRELSSEMERLAFRIAWRTQIKQKVSLGSARKLWELGPKESFRRAMAALTWR
jgi:anaerobic magnesium-protoporphyrin IX monomethyl ester cyclase